MNEEKSDGVGEVKRADAGETAQSIDKDDKSLSSIDQDIILREDIKEEFTKFGTVRVI
jgi:lupus La protein